MAGDGGEGAKFWLAVLTEIKNRGAADVCIVVCDGLKGLPEAITTRGTGRLFRRVIHLLRNTFRYASRKYWDRIAKDIRPVYTAPTEAAARNASPSSPRPGVSSIRRSSGYGRTRGVNSCRSWTTTSKSEGSSAVRTPSNPSTLVTGARFAPAGTSQPSRPR